MKKYKWIIILANLAGLLLFFNLSLVKKEKILSDGKLILLKLAPIDPRSLMQGDYMRLNYEISSRRTLRMETEDYPVRGYVVVILDENGVASKVRMQAKRQPLAQGEYLIEYTSSNWWGNPVDIGAGSYFFQEGEGRKYEKAVYGGVKVDQNGNSVLIGLYDENRELIGK